LFTDNQVMGWNNYDFSETISPGIEFKINKFSMRIGENTVLNNVELEGNRHTINNIKAKIINFRDTTKEIDAELVLNNNSFSQKVSVGPNVTQVIDFNVDLELDKTYEGYVKIPNVAGVLGLVSCLVLWPFLIPKYGIVGTAAGFLVSTIVTSSIQLYYAWRHFNLDLKKFSQILLISSSVFAVALLIKSILLFFPTLISTAVFTVIFCAVFRRDLSDIYRKTIGVILPA